jgi:DNA-binding transcriptional LysR family regulator
VGIRLLQRTTRSVTLTDAGLRYLERARRIVAEIEEADATARAERSAPTGRLVVSAPVLFGRIHVGPLMCRYLNAYPAVTGELLLSDRTVNLVEDGVDLAVRIGHLADSSLIARRAGVTRRVLVGSPGYLERRGEPSTPLELSRHQTIQFSPLAASADWSFREGDRDLRVPLASHYATNSADAALWHAEHDGGLTFALSYQVADAVKAGRLRMVLEAFEPPPLPIHFVYPSSRLLSAKVRTFVELAAATCDWRF